MDEREDIENLVKGFEFTAPLDPSARIPPGFLPTGVAGKILSIRLADGSIEHVVTQADGSLVPLPITGQKHNLSGVKTLFEQHMKEPEFDLIHAVATIKDKK